MWNVHKPTQGFIKCHFQFFRYRLYHTYIFICNTNSISVAELFESILNAKMSPSANAVVQPVNVEELAYSFEVIFGFALAHIEKLEDVGCNCERFQISTVTLALG